MLFKSSNPDMDKYMKYPKFLLSTMGCWPAVKSQISWIYKIRFIFAYSFSCCFTTSLLLNLFFSLNDLATAADSVYFLSTIFTYLIKLMIFSKKSDKFQNLLRDLDNPLFLPTVKNHIESTKKWIDKAYFYCGLFAYSVVVCVTLFGLIPVFDKNSLLPCLGWFPFDPEYSSFVFSATYIFQVIGISIAAIINVSLDLLPPVFMNIGCAQVEILKYNLEHAIEDSIRAAGMKDEIEVLDSDEAKKNVDNNYFDPLSPAEEKILLQILIRCVKHHEAIIRLFYEIQYVFNPGLLIQFLSCAVTLCMTGFQLIVVPIMSVKFLFVAEYFFVMVVEVALYTNGNHVIVETATISNSCYEMEWYRCSTKVKKMLIIIMERCKRPNLISAGGIFDVSISTLTFLLRTSYSYFTVLNRMYSE